MEIDSNNIWIYIKRTNVLQQKNKITLRNVGKANSSRRESLLVGPWELQNVTESSNLNRTFDTIGPDSGSDQMGDLKHVNTCRNVAILEVPPNGNPDISRLFVVAPRRRWGRERVITGRKRSWKLRKVKQEGARRRRRTERRKRESWGGEEPHPKVIENNNTMVDSGIRVWKREEAIPLSLLQLVQRGFRRRRGRRRS